MDRLTTHKQFFGMQKQTAYTPTLTVGMDLAARVGVQELERLTGNKGQGESPSLYQMFN